MLDRTGQVRWFQSYHTMKNTDEPTNPELDITASHELLNSILDRGLDGLPAALSILINQAMIAERSSALGAGPYQRSQDRKGHANGFKHRTFNTRMGPLDLAIPQVRGEVEFFPSALERGQRSERALKVAIAEMYVQGVSTRRVTAILQQLCGLEVSSTDVSRASKLLDEELERWRNRPLPAISHLILDAQYHKVRFNGAVRSVALLVAIGVLADSKKRCVLGVSVSLSEAEIHWRTFLQSLQKRGMNGLLSVTSDDHAGLRAALAAVLPSVPWQRCQFHLQQNAQAMVPRVEMRSQVARDIRSIFEADRLGSAQIRLREVVDSYREAAPKLVDWIEANIPEGLTIFELPGNTRKRLRTVNAAEHLNKQIRRRTRVAALFPNEPSLLRLASAVLMEISEEWEAGKAYLPSETNL